MFFHRYLYCTANSSREMNAREAQTECEDLEFTEVHLASHGELNDDVSGRR